MLFWKAALKIENCTFSDIFYNGCYTLAQSNLISIYNTYFGLCPFLFFFSFILGCFLQMSTWSHNPCEWDQKVLCLYLVCYTALPPWDLCGPVTLQIHLPLPGGLQRTALWDDPGNLQGGRGPELQLPLRHLHLLHGIIG